MKISNSKKQLAQIIHENGGWRDGAEWAAQDKDGEVFGYCQKPTMGVSREVWGGDGCTGPWAAHVDTVRNWHQTILSRDEYFHLYQEHGLEAALDEPFVREESKPTIEQLATDYRNAKDYAERKQEESDAAKADADAKLAELVAAGKALGLVLSVAGVEPGLVITEIEDLLEGDVIELTAGLRYNKTECAMVHVPGLGLRAKSSSDTDSDWWNLDGHQKTEWRFIRRP